VVFHYLDPMAPVVVFRSKSGPLAVTRAGERLCLDFPARPPIPCPCAPEIEVALGRAPRAVLRAQRDYLAVFESEGDVRTLAPSMERVAAVDALGVIATAPGRGVDLVPRFLPPAACLPPDAVTGSAHFPLLPYWPQRRRRNH